MANKAKTTQTDVAAPVAEIVAYKGFDSKMQCRGFQFEMVKTFTHDGEVKHCKSGFHACENPLDTFNYYAPGTSKFAVVKMSGAISRESDGDTKIASASITIDAELTIPTIVSKAIEWITALCKPENFQHATGDQSASSATSDQSASSATGDRSASSATGDQSASSATGDRSASSATGYRSASSATGENAVAMNIGLFGKAKASKDGAIVLCAHDENGNLIHIRASKVGENGIYPDVFYTLNSEGEFVKEGGEA